MRKWTMVYWATFTWPFLFKRRKWYVYHVLTYNQAFGQQKKKMICTCTSRVSIQSGVRAAEPNDLNNYMYEYIALQSNEL